MKGAIAAARRIVAAYDLGHEFRSADAWTVARALIELADAKDDLAELWEIAERAVQGEWMVTSCMIIGHSQSAPWMTKIFLASRNAAVSTGLISRPSKCNGKVMLTTSPRSAPPWRGA